MSAANISQLAAESPVRTSYDRGGLIIQNSAQRLTPEIAEALQTRAGAHMRALEIDHELDRTPEMRREDSALRVRTSRIMSDPGSGAARLEGELREAALKRSEQIANALQRRINKRKAMLVSAFSKWGEDFAAVPVDHSFWWAQTRAHFAPGMSGEFRNDGLHFWAGPKVNDYDGEMHTSFGAVASFALQPSRFPTSPNGLLLSVPHVEIFGGVVAHAPNWDLIQGNGIASCRLFLRQTLFQWVFGMDGPAQAIVAEAKVEDDWHIYLKNTGYSLHADMPGMKLMPQVIYRQDALYPQELWAELEVRFDIYLNCTGALVWCDPNVLLRTWQWSPVPLP